MNIRTHAKRRMRDRSRHHIYVGGWKLRKGRIYSCRGVWPDGRIFVEGWFVADGPDPEVHLPTR